VGRRKQYYYDLTSPGKDSDGNHYESPVVSPGHWNMSSPASNYNTISPQSNSSIRGTPSSTSSGEVRSQPPSTPPSQSKAPTLPVKLGDQDVNRKETIDKSFMQKTSKDREREKLASRRVKSMMVEATRNRSQTFGKKEAKSFLVPNGTEAFATSSRKKKEPIPMEDLKGSVNDFKCGLDLDREWAAKKHALRIITKLDNAA